MRPEPAAASCPICESRRVRVRAELQPDAGNARYHAVACLDCGLVYSDPMPRLSFDEMQSVYGSEYIDDQSAMGGTDASLEAIRAATHRQMDLVERHVRPGVALNVGATSEAVKVIAERGWDLRLVEGSAYSAEKARRDWGFDVTTSRIEDFTAPPATFDFVKLGHVIEHLSDPVAVLARLAQFVKPGGVILVDTDNAHGLRTRVETSVRALFGEERAMALVRRFTGKNLRKRYGTLTPPMHLYAFTRASLDRALQRGGFEVVERWRPALGDPTWFPITEGARLSTAERTLMHVCRVGGWFGAGDVVAALGRRS